MFNSLIVKLLFAGYDRKFKKIESKNLTVFQKAVLWTRYYLPKQKLVAKFVPDEELSKIWSKATLDLNKFCECAVPREGVDLWGNYNFYFSDFVGLKLDRKIVKNLCSGVFRFVFRVSTDLLVKLNDLFLCFFSFTKKIILKVKRD